MCTGAEGMVAANADKIILASTAISALGNLQEGKQAQRFYNYKADQASADAEYERQMGEVRAGKVRKAGAVVQSEVRAGYAGSGVDVNTGTPVAVAQKLERNIGEDAIAQLLTGQRRGQVLEQQASLDRMAGANAKTGGVLAASRSLLGGAAVSMNASTARDKWIRMAQQDFARTKRAEFTGFEDAGF